MNRRALFLLGVGGGVLLLAAGGAGLWWTGLGGKILGRSVKPAVSTVSATKEEISEPQASPASEAQEEPSLRSEDAREAGTRAEGRVPTPPAWVGRPAPKERLALSQSPPALAEIYAAMRPQEAASVLSRLEPKFAAQILREMTPRKAARVLGAIDPDRAAILTNAIMQDSEELTP